MESQRRHGKQGFALQPTKGDFSRKVPFGILQKLYSKGFLNKAFVFPGGGVLGSAVSPFVRAGDPPFDAERQMTPHALPTTYKPQREKFFAFGYR